MKGIPPTKAERVWFDSITEIGCIVCRNEGLGKTPASPHHMLDTGRRMGHLFTIPLCHKHHQEGSDNAAWTSRHPHEARFEARYGSEFELLEQVKRLVEVKNGNQADQF